jgi:hypothetical protein
MVPRKPATSVDPESGRILLLSLGFAVLGLMIVAMVVASTAVHLDRKRLLNLADIAAVEAAGSLDGTRLFGLEATPSYLPLTDARVAEAAAASVESNAVFGAGHMDQIRIVRATSSDGVTAEVTLAAVTNPPLLGWFTDAFLGGIDLTAESHARSRTR